MFLKKNIAKDHLIHFYGSALSVLSICTVSSLRELVVPMDDYDFILSNPVEGRVLRKKNYQKKASL